MASFNKVILMGNLTADPELKQTASGVSVCSFTVAVNRRFKAENGQQECDFITVVTWRQQAEFVSRHFKKGKSILLCGQLQTRSWTDNQGQKRYATEVVADEVSFAGNSADNVGAAVTPASSGAQLGLVGANMPSEYGGKAVQFEELSEDEQLPF